MFQIFGEIITSVSDPGVALLTVLVPMLLLYELSILLAARIENTRRLEAEAN